MAGVAPLEISRLWFQVIAFDSVITSVQIEKYREGVLDTPGNVIDNNTSWDECPGIRSRQSLHLAGQASGVGEEGNIQISLNLNKPSHNNVVPFYEPDIPHFS